jgi:hypothetical protein
VSHRAGISDAIIEQSPRRLLARPATSSTSVSPSLGGPVPSSNSIVRKKMTAFRDVENAAGALSQWSEESKAPDCKIILRNCVETLAVVDAHGDPHEPTKY